MSKPKVLVDMSATLIHHGHIRLLESASHLGSVTVALTSDSEIIKHKGYSPELTFDQRREILMAIRFVDSVIESPWIIDDAFMEKHKMQILVHGDDNSNTVREDYLVLVPRTEEVSSTRIRELASEAIAKRRQFLESTSHAT